jgi:hypothetical protein
MSITPEDVHKIASGMREGWGGKMGMKYCQQESEK